MDLMASGVVAVSVADASQAERLGFDQGHIIRQINGDRIGSVAQLRRALDGTDSWQIGLQRGDKFLNLAVR